MKGCSFNLLFVVFLSHLSGALPLSFGGVLVEFWLSVDSLEAMVERKEEEDGEG